MREGQGSRTAERVAQRRAVHQLLDRPLVFEDPLALAVIDPEVASLLKANPHALETSPLSPFLRAAFAVRSRVAEDEVRAAATEDRIGQYVVLGAGFDTFAYRNPYPAMRVFEVDHPATQEIKRKRLAEGSIAVPAGTVYVSTDFGEANLSAVLRSAGFNLEAPAVFSWLGVVPYLEPPAIEETLRLVGSLSRGSRIVFDYARPASSLGWWSRAVLDRMAQRVASVGEPWKTFFEPKQVGELLKSAGLTVTADLGSEELNQQYFAGRTDRLRVGEAMRIVKAAV